MRSPNHRVIEIIRDPFSGTLPGFIELGHRHLEKSNPAPARTLGTGYMKTYLIPLDLMAMVLPAEVLKNVDSVEFHYKEPKK